MALHLLATVLTSDEAAHATESGVSPWWFGAAAFGAFLLLLFIVTRLNLDR